MQHYHTSPADRVQVLEQLYLSRQKSVKNESIFKELYLTQLQQQKEIFNSQEQQSNFW